MANDQYKEKILGGYDFFKTLSPELQKEVHAAAHYVKLEKGQNFFTKGDDVNVIALVGKGSVRVYISGETGREVSLYRVEPGGSCPINILTAIFDRPAPANAVVEQDIEAVILPSNDFKNWVNQDETVRSFVFDALIHRFVRVMHIIEDLTSRRLDQRLSEFLLSRFSKIQEEPKKLKITHEQIASELGTAREVVSRLLSQLESSESVELKRGEITLRDPKQLQKMCNMT